MDLALELGMTVAELKDRMTVQELERWRLYRDWKLLPLRRLEHYLARIAQVTAGGDFADFLFEPARPDAATTSAAPAAPQALAAAAAIVGDTGLRVIVVPKE
jgi:hypothetical protein